MLGGNEASGVANSNTFGDFATLDGSGNVVAYTGYVPVSAGAVTSSATANVKFSADTAGITIGALPEDVSDLNTVLVTLDNVANRALTVAGTLKLGSANPGGSSTAIYRTATPVQHNRTFTVTGGTITAKGGGELNILDSTNSNGEAFLTALSGFAAQNNNLTITSIIADDGANPVHVNIMGYVVMNNANNIVHGRDDGHTRARQDRARSHGDRQQPWP